MKRLSILGSTGSIGTATLSLVDEYPDRLQVVALAAQNNGELLANQIRKYRPQVAALHDATIAQELGPFNSPTRIIGGPEAVIEAATSPDADIVVSAISGSAGLLPTYHAVQSGKDIALANKETLVVAGDLIMREISARGSSLIPVDSEHSALHQCLQGSQGSDVSRLILTASGGPFRKFDLEQLSRVSVEEALKHPTWEMGPKITIDSATLMNKGLEIIEAHYLFGFPSEQISVAIHPQSVVHSLVEFIDGSLLAQLAITDMRACLLYALAHPARWESRLPRLNLFEMGPITFDRPDTQRFPCLKLASEALSRGNGYPVVLNAANEVAVEQFLNGKIPFMAISAIIESTLEQHESCNVFSLEDVIECDKHSRSVAHSISKEKAQSVGR